MKLWEIVKTLETEVVTLMSEILCNQSGPTLV
jgi:hypothetical protein